MHRPAAHAYGRLLLWISACSGNSSAAQRWVCTTKKVQVKRRSGLQITPTISVASQQHREDGQDRERRQRAAARSPTVEGEGSHEWYVNGDQAPPSRLRVAKSFSAIGPQPNSRGQTSSTRYDADANPMQTRRRPSANRNSGPSASSTAKPNGRRKPKLKRHARATSSVPASGRASARSSTSSRRRLISSPRRRRKRGAWRSL